MSGKHPANPAKAAFLAELKALRRASGQPACRALAATSELLPKLYPERALPTLSATAVSEVLNGRREGLPSAAWVAAFVLCCQRLAREACIVDDEPDVSDVKVWLQKLQAAQDAIEVGTPLPSDLHAPHKAAAEEPSRRRVDLGTPDPRGHPDGEAGSAARTARMAPAGPDKLPAAEREYLASYGSHGQELLAAMKADTPDAVHRAAILLGASSTHRDTALSLLLTAAAAEHYESIEFLDANPEQSMLHPQDVAARATVMGAAAAAEGASAAALAYYRCAARCDSDSLEAAVRLASAQLTEYGDPEAADLLLAAANRADPAELIASEPRRIDRIRSEAILTSEMMLGPMADETDSPSA